MSKPMTAARPVRRLASMGVRPGFMAFMRAIGPAYFRFLLGFNSVRILHVERLVSAYTDFFGGRCRLIIGFRHPYGDEPHLMTYVIGKLLVREARRLGVRFPKLPHAHFVYGYEVPLWAGAFERWVLPRGGAVPVYHAKLDAAGVERIRSLMKDGEYPLALAPEGQVSYTSEGLPRIEQGVVRIAIWCAQDLRKENRPQSVSILPVSIHYTWPKTAERGLLGVISQAEKRCGILPPTGMPAFDRLSAVADRVLSLMEGHYSRFYGVPAPPGSPSRAERLSRVLEAALGAGERILSIEPSGDVIQRVYKIRQIAWDRIYRADIEDLDSLTPLERRLADRLAAEAWMASRHMELVDLGFYLDFDRLKPDDPPELFIETAQNYFDLISRLSGGNYSDRMAVRGKRATVVVAEPIRVGNALEDFARDRKKTLDSLTDDLARAFHSCIEEVQEARRKAATVK